MKKEIVQTINEQEEGPGDEEEVADFDAFEVECVAPQQKALSSISEKPHEEDILSVKVKPRRKPMKSIDEDEG